MRLDGIVSKRRDAPYRSGKQCSCSWVKVKCATWREANKERWRLFERRS
jgi:ATP-dependent DNA ligase